MSTHNTYRWLKAWFQKTFSSIDTDAFFSSLCSFSMKTGKGPKIAYFKALANYKAHVRFL